MGKKYLVRFKMLSHKPKLYHKMRMVSRPMSLDYRELGKENVGR